jgi:signal transduction histidine kinase
VLINLLRNAAHAIDELEDPTGAGVKVSTWASDEFAYVQVADDGPGISAATRDSIFDLFFTTHAEGTGIGLFVCKTLVTGWGGTIQLGPSDGEGACFTVSIPLARG